MPDEEAVAETPRRERFRRVATRRTRQVLKDIQRLANCANRSAYEYSDEDTAKIFSAIERELANTRARFDRGKKKEVDFELG